MTTLRGTVETAVDDVTGADVAAIVGRSADADFVSGMGSLAADTAREAASAYTRGVGFETDGEIPQSLRHVILFRAVRIVGNYQQLLSEGRDGVSMNYGAAAQGWTTGETMVLDEYRRKSCSI